MELGIAGAAYATVIAQIISVILCLVYIHRKCQMLSFSRKSLIWDKKLVKELLLMGFSMALMLVVVSIGSVALQGAVNYLGEDIVAAHTAARKIDDIFMLTIGTLSVTVATFAGQNIGAGMIDRVYKGVRNAVGIAMLWSFFSMLMIFLFGERLIKLISGTGNPVIIQTAYRYMRINVSFFVVLSILVILRNGLQGIGRKLVPVLGSTVELIFKFVAVGIITKKLGYFGVCILEPIIWCVCAVMVLADFLIFVKQTKTGEYANREL